jgi:hypothetical protein
MVLGLINYFITPDIWLETWEPNNFLFVPGTVYNVFTLPKRNNNELTIDITPCRHDRQFTSSPENTHSLPVVETVTKLFF